MDLKLEYFETETKLLRNGNSRQQWQLGAMTVMLLWSDLPVVPKMHGTPALLMIKQ